ncbi:hypothetical protein MMCCUG48898_1666 [Mycobacteroides abscessus subsp. massiliense CCUG 48898 = JCM 15300]|nr:hypothetical protein MMCCUG48898_1666 [Mycobacteroides abscessus subsp. massiliense CCUG 48898 = JCM 15300]BAP96621.1 hypothetical protein MMASJCM_1845 [Mycobacteroides abscessus subsp. massiliense CCUG 48898 = JCM 15300]
MHGYQTQGPWHSLLMLAPAARSLSPVLSSLLGRSRDLLDTL